MTGDNIINLPIIQFQPVPVFKRDGKPVFRSSQTVLDKNIIYEAPGNDTYRKQLKERDFSDEYIDAMIAVFGKIKQRKVMNPTDTVKKILGREPLTLAEYVQENREVFS